MERSLKSTWLGFTVFFLCGGVFPSGAADNEVLFDGVQMKEAQVLLSKGLMSQSESAEHRHSAAQGFGRAETSWWTHLLG